MIKTFIAILIGVVGFSAHAADQSSGCGLGWKVNSRNSLSGTTTRGTTNPYGISSFFGTSFGTSGCEKHSIVQKEKRAIHYAESNYDNLILEMAKGSGEFLNGFAATLGCKSELFGPTMQKNYSKIYQHGSSAAPLLKEVTEVIQLDSNLRSQCIATAS